MEHVSSCVKFKKLAMETFKMVKSAFGELSAALE
jgi:hypothetical protein